MIQMSNCLTKAVMARLVNWHRGVASYRCLKSSLEAGQFIKDTAQGPDVTLLVVRLAFTQLGRYIAWRPHHL